MCMSGLGLYSTNEPTMNYDQPEGPTKSHRFTCVHNTHCPGSVVCVSIVVLVYWPKWVPQQSVSTHLHSSLSISKYLPLTHEWIKMCPVKELRLQMGRWEDEWLLFMFKLHRSYRNTSTCTGFKKSPGQVTVCKQQMNIFIHVRERRINKTHLPFSVGLFTQMQKKRRAIRPGMRGRHSASHSPVGMIQWK